MTEKNPFAIKLPPYTIYAIFSLVILVITFVAILFTVPEGSFLIIQGEIGDKYTFLSLFLVTFVICSINLIAAWNLYKKDRVVSHIFGTMAVLISSVILLKVATIVLIY